MAVGYHAVSATLYYDMGDITSTTNRRDVSELLDLWVHRKTPFLNYIKWGPESGGKVIEWLSEHTGLGFLRSLTEITASGDTIIIGTSGISLSAEALKQISTGALLMGWSSAQATHTFWLVEDLSTTGEIAVGALITGTVDVQENLYILGNFANEGSIPRIDRTRARAIITNNMAILRKDVRITGSMLATDMYSVPSEMRHQMMIRLLEMQREREMACLFSQPQTQSTTAAGLLKGVHYFLLPAGASPGDHVDITTTTLTESAFNTVVAACWDNGCKPNAAFGSATQIRKFTEWDRTRVRTRPEAKMGGFHVTSYLTDIGYEIDLVPIMQFPKQALFVLDTAQIRLKAKKGRKLTTEKLGITGDYTEYQMISEFSMEARGSETHTLGGMFGHLA